MKNLCITFLTIAIIIVLSVFSFNRTDSEYLRIHIRANSNSQTDQSVKYEIRDEIVKYLTPLVAGCDSKEKAVNMLNDNLSNIVKVAEKVLKDNGFNYGASAKVKSEEFPTRVYDGVTLEKGIYDALIVYLGSGTGDNWWCVVYPPLCFVGDGTSYVYKSRIKEIIEDFFK